MDLYTKRNDALQSEKGPLRTVAKRRQADKSLHRIHGQKSNYISHQGYITVLSFG